MKRPGKHDRFFRITFWFYLFWVSAVMRHGGFQEKDTEKKNSKTTQKAIWPAYSLEIFCNLLAAFFHTLDHNYDCKVTLFLICFWSGGAGTYAFYLIAFVFPTYLLLVDNLAYCTIVIQVIPLNNHDWTKSKSVVELNRRERFDSVQSDMSDISAAYMQIKCFISLRKHPPFIAC